MPSVRQDQCKAQIIHHNYTRCCQLNDGHIGKHQFEPRPHATRFDQYFEQVWGEPFQRDPDKPNHTYDLSEFTSQTECGTECIKCVDAFHAARWYAGNAGETDKLIELCRSACEVLIYG